jgi:pimeloyl-ACP methyl ester carboxylesterase
MSNSHVLVAGTGGITLMDETGSDLGYPVRMRIGVLSAKLAKLPAPELTELLSMEHRPGQIEPAKTSLKAGVSIRPGHVLTVAYNQIPDSFNHFLYDWRADMRYSAGQLLDFLQQRKPTGGRWNIVAHSQGGLLVILASKMLPDREDFSKLVAGVTLVGVPLAGTVNAALAMINGDQMGETTVSQFKDILRTWPSLYQMMPAWPAMVDSAGAPLPSAAQLTSRGGWGTLPNISDDLLRRAVEVQRQLRDPLAWMEGNIQVRALFAVNRNTGVTLKTDANGPMGKVGGETKGDSLVPYDQTMRWIGEHLVPFVESYQAPCREHAFLNCDPAIVTRIKQLLIA